LKQRLKSLVNVPKTEGHLCLLWSRAGSQSIAISCPSLLQIAVLGGLHDLEYYLCLAYGNNLSAASKLLPRHLPSTCSPVDFFLPTSLFTSYCRSFILLICRKTRPYTTFSRSSADILSKERWSRVKSFLTNHVDRGQVLLHVASNPNHNPLSGCVLTGGQGLGTTTPLPSRHHLLLNFPTQPHHHLAMFIDIADAIKFCICAYIFLALFFLVLTDVLSSAPPNP
jgi:hypothetical protein